MKISSVVIFAISQAIAFTTTTGIVFAIPLIATLISIMSLEDPGGPMFVPVFAVMCLVCGISISLLFFIYTAALQLVRLKYKYPAWLPPVLSLPLTCFMSLLFTPYFPQNTTIITAIIASVLFILYILYWLIASAASKFLGKIHTTFFNKADRRTGKPCSADAVL